MKEDGRVLPVTGEVTGATSSSSSSCGLVPAPGKNGMGVIKVDSRPVRLWGRHKTGSDSSELHSPWLELAHREGRAVGSPCSSAGS